MIQLPIEVAKVQERAVKRPPPSKESGVNNVYPRGVFSAMLFRDQDACFNEASKRQAICSALEEFLGVEITPLLINTTEKITKGTAETQSRTFAECSQRCT